MTTHPLLILYQPIITLYEHIHVGLNIHSHIQPPPVSILQVTAPELSPAGVAFLPSPQVVRARLNDLVGSYESDPVLKAFLMSSIQPKDNNDSAGSSVGGSGSSSSGGNANSNHVIDSIIAGDEVEALFTKIKRNKQQQSNSATTTTTTTATTTTTTDATTTATATATAIGGPIGPSVDVSNPGPAPLEWKFSVEGIYQSRFAVAQFLSDNTSDDATATVTTSDTIATTSDGDSASSSILVFKRPVLVMKGATSPFVRYA